MPLVDVSIEPSTAPLPPLISEFLDEAQRRIDLFQASNLVPGFVPSDFSNVYGVLRAITDSQLSTGPRFCEWGSGFGVVTCLASLLGFEACGIEVENELVLLARELAEQFDVSATFHHSSFIPVGGERLAECAYTDSTDGIAWLSTYAGDELDDWQLTPDEFDTIFAYPWPDEENAIARLFNRFASAGAILITHHSNAEVHVRRKVR